MAVASLFWRHNSRQIPIPAVPNLGVITSKGVNWDFWRSKDMYMDRIIVQPQNKIMRTKSCLSNITT